jgi:hemolysin D
MTAESHTVLAPANSGRWLTVPPLRSLSARIGALATEREDKEFLPAHLEILDTPPAPLAGAFVWVMCGAFASALAWSCFAYIDIHAVASGRVQLSGRSKVVQPLYGGRVRSVLIQNGSAVKAGEILLELDATETTAELQAQSANLESLEAEIARRTIQIEAIRRDEPSAAPIFPPNTSEPIRQREQAVFTAEMAQYLSSRASLNAQLVERDAAKQRLASSLQARSRLLAVLKERSDMRETLVARAAGTRAAVIDAVQQVESVATDQAREQGQLLETAAAIESLQRRIEQLRQEFIAQQAQKLTEAAQKRDQASQEVVKARMKFDQTRLTAPIDGTVQQLAVTTLGQVVTAGQPLMVLVPSEGAIEIEALIVNQDIGFVQVGNEAIVKVDSFPFTRYGTLEGRVSRISRDAIDQRDASGATDTTSMAQGQSVASPVAGAPRTQNLVFPVTIVLDKRKITFDGREMPLVPGMTTTVEIRTDKRRVIDYLLGPLREVVATAGHER